MKNFILLTIIVLTSIMFAGNVVISNITKVEDFKRTANDSDYVTYDTLLVIGASDSLEVSSITIAMSPFINDTHEKGLIISDLVISLDTLCSNNVSITGVDNAMSDIVSQNGNVVNIAFPSGFIYNNTSVVLITRQISESRYNFMGSFTDYFAGAIININIIGTD